MRLFSTLIVLGVLACTVTLASKPQQHGQLQAGWPANPVSWRACGRRINLKLR
jgi:hypothetical protein